MLDSNHTTEDSFADAFRWVVSVFRAQDIPFQVSGGLAARAYGSVRPLRDLDFDIPDEHMENLAMVVAPFVQHGPVRTRSLAFENLLLTLGYHGVAIDIGGGTTSRIWNPSTRMLEDCVTDCAVFEKKEIFGVCVPVIRASDFIAYKSFDPREEDVEDILAAQQYLGQQT